MNIGILASTEKDKYVFKTLFDTLGLGYQFIKNAPEDYDVVITHGENLNGVNSINIINSSQNFPSIDWFESDNYKLPIFFSFTPSTQGQVLCYYKGKDKRPAILYREENGYSKIIIGPDIISSVYYLLTLSYELNSNFKHNLLLRPLVTEYMNLLFDFIKFISLKIKQPIIQKWYWPHNEPFAVCLTHDIDFINLWWFNTIQRILELVKNREFGDVLNVTTKALKAISKGKNPFFNFNKIIKLEQQRGFKSTFFFLTDGGPIKKIIENKGGTYYPKDVKKLIKKITDSNWDVGLHGSINSYNNYKKLNSERNKLAELLNKPDFGIRQHFLRFEPNQTWRIQEKCGFLFDTTLAYPDSPAFRGGISFPFYPYDEINNREINILEIPLNIMDRRFTKYGLVDDPWDVSIRTIEEIEKYNGLCTILWHNSSIDEGGFSGYFEIYRKILDLIKSNNGYGVSAEELTEWWTIRRDFKLVNLEKDFKTTQWNFCSKFKMPFFTFRIYMPSKKIKKIIVEGVKNDLEFYEGFITVRTRDIVQNKVISIRIEKE